MQRLTDESVNCPWCLKTGLYIEVRPKSVGRFCLKKCGYRAWLWKHELTRKEVETYYAKVPKKKRTPEFRNASPCRKCHNPIRLRESPFKTSKLKKPYYFTAYWWCDKCGTMYMDDQFKVLNQDVMNENIAANLELGKNNL